MMIKLTRKVYGMYEYVYCVQVSINSGEKSENNLSMKLICQHLEMSLQVYILKICHVILAHVCLQGILTYLVAAMYIPTLYKGIQNIINDAYFHL